ncbi:MAG: hypothetical protein IKS71_06585 [Bacteroidales bacterium]|nr:hypothetical protein [Bacteroidales bacterium]
MKKYFIIAAAAVVAMAGCSKSEILFDETNPGNKIGFEVANYARQTKANQTITNSEDGIYSFHTVAYQFPTIGSPREFMDVDILPYNVTGTTTTQVTAANDNDYTITKWAPAQDYYWPKTGYINFYSYAGSHTPDVDVNDDDDWKTVTFTYEDAVITATSNIMVAEAALHYGRTNSEDETYKVDDSESSEHVTKGVPTLFHHQLAKIKFDVRARTTSDKVSDNTTWKVQVLATQAYGDETLKSHITPIEKGTLVLTNVDDASSASRKAWSNAATATNISGWAPSSDTEDIVFTATADVASAPAVLTIPAGAVQSLTSGETPAPYDPEVILDWRSVMPQLTENVPFTLVYKVQALHGSTVFMEEVRTVGIPAIDGGEAKDLKDLVSSLTSWAANKKIIYHITIDPVSEIVTFDPAVEDYDPVEEYNGYINEGGITSEF